MGPNSRYIGFPVTPLQTVKHGWENPKEGAMKAHRRFVPVVQETTSHWQPLPLDLLATHQLQDTSHLRIMHN